MDNIRAIMEADYALPDPAWDYYEIYIGCQDSLKKLQKLIKYMSDIEDATPEADASIKTQLDAIGVNLNGARRKMDS